MSVLDVKRMTRVEYNAAKARMDAELAAMAEQRKGHGG